MTFKIQAQVRLASSHKEARGASLGRSLDGPQAAPDALKGAHGEPACSAITSALCSPIPGLQGTRPQLSRPGSAYSIPFCSLLPGPNPASTTSAVAETLSLRPLSLQRKNTGCVC